MCFPSARIAIKASQLARTKNGRPGRPLQRGVSVSDAPPSLPRPRHQDDRHERQKRHEHERRDRNAQRPFHVFAHHFTSFRSNLQKRPHAAKVATAYLAVAAPPPADGAGALPVHAVHACRCGEPGSAVGEPGLELPARHRSDRGGSAPRPPRCSRRPRPTPWATWTSPASTTSACAPRMCRSAPTASSSAAAASYRCSRAGSSPSG